MAQRAVVTHVHDRVMSTAVATPPVQRAVRVEEPELPIPKFASRTSPSLPSTPTPPTPRDAPLSMNRSTSIAANWAGLVERPPEECRSGAVAPGQSSTMELAEGRQLSVVSMTCGTPPTQVTRYSLLCP